MVDTPEARFLIDTSRIESADGFMSVWLRIDFSAPRPLSATDSFRTTQLRQELKCGSRSGRTREMNAYMPGSDSSQFLVFPDTSWLPFERQQLEAVYSDGACLQLQRLDRLPPA